jgi:hypothetical protein
MLVTSSADPYIFEQLAKEEQIENTKDPSSRPKQCIYIYIYIYIYVASES